MRSLEQTASGADDGALNARLHHAMHQSFGATLFEPLPADLLTLAIG